MEVRPGSPSIRSTRPISVRSPSVTISPHHIATDANSKYRLNVESAYVQDRSRSPAGCNSWSAHATTFSTSAFDRNSFAHRTRAVQMVAPKAAAILKPIDTVSLYTAWSINYLPASGDQFSALNTGTLILQPQKFEQTGGRRRSGTSIRDCCSRGRL